MSRNDENAQKGADGLNGNGTPQAAANDTAPQTPTNPGGGFSKTVIALLSGCMVLVGIAGFVWVVFLHKPSDFISRLIVIGDILVVAEIILGVKIILVSERKNNVEAAAPLTPANPGEGSAQEIKMKCRYLWILPVTAAIIIGGIVWLILLGIKTDTLVNNEKLNIALGVYYSILTALILAAVIIAAVFTVNVSK